MFLSFHTGVGFGFFGIEWRKRRMLAPRTSTVLVQSSLLAQPTTSWFDFDFDLIWFDSFSLQPLLWIFRSTDISQLSLKTLKHVWAQQLFWTRLNPAIFFSIFAEPLELVQRGLNGRIWTWYLAVFKTLLVKIPLLMYNTFVECSLKPHFLWSLVLALLTDTLCLRHTRAWPY